MLVIVGDLHLTDGTSGATASPDAFQLLADRVQELAARASCRSDGSYRPIDRVDVILLGDVLDVIESQQWLERSIRPWDDPHSVELIETVTAITEDILQHNAAALNVLRSLASEATVQTLPGGALGRSARSSEGVPLGVRIHYMVGNRDWFFHLPGHAYDALRQRIVSQLGLANRYDLAFPHDARESEELLEILRRHKVLARHGDLFDPLHFDGDRDTSCVGDAVVIELINRFCARIESEFASELPAAVLLGLREIYHVRPVLLVPVWIDGLLERTCPLPSLRRQVQRIWDGLAEEFLELPLVRSRGTGHQIEMLDGLERALKFSQRLSAGWASWTLAWANRLRGANDVSYACHALAEPDFRNRRAKHIVYGHTHGTETVPLDASFAENYVLNQIYFNAGTWQRAYRQTHGGTSEHEFIASDTLTYLAFFQGDERKGRPYETWTGALGTGSSDVTLHRIDAGVAKHAIEQSLPAPGLSSHRPHFAPSSARARVVPIRRI